MKRRGRNAHRLIKLKALDGETVARQDEVGLHNLDTLEAVTGRLESKLTDACVEPADELGPLAVELRGDPANYSQSRSRR